MLIDFLQAHVQQTKIHSPRPITFGTREMNGSVSLPPRKALRSSHGTIPEVTETKYSDNEAGPETDDESGYRTTKPEPR
jgi:hypothetical protein